MLRRGIGLIDVHIIITDRCENQFLISYETSVLSASNIVYLKINEQFTSLNRFVLFGIVHISIRCVGLSCHITQSYVKMRVQYRYVH